jgi:hypothetical protein
MGKITVSSVAHIHDKDVDINKKVDARRLDEKTDLCVVRATRALEIETPGYTELHRVNMSFIITSMQATHRAMKKVLGSGPDKPESIDAMVLARVNLEGLYALCLMFESSGYVDCYLQDGWRKLYVKFILQREETKKLPRFDDYSQRIAPASLTGLRKIFGITEIQQQTIDHEELGAPLRTGSKPVPIPRFPTPGGVIDKIPAGDRRQMLERLYLEYQRLSSFAHGLSEANQFKEMCRRDSRFAGVFSEDQLRETFHREVEELSWIVSRLSIIQSVAELTSLYKGNVDLCAAATQAWLEFSDGILLAKTIWEIRTKKLLGVVI